MNTQKGVDLEQAFNTFVGHLNLLGLTNNLSLNELQAAYKLGFDNGRHSHVKESLSSNIPTTQENKPVIEKSILEMKKQDFRSEVIEYILMIYARPLTPSEIGGIAKKDYDVHWYEKSVCGFIQHAIQNGKNIKHVKTGFKRGKYVHTDYLEFYEESLLEEGAAE